MGGLLITLSLLAWLAFTASRLIHKQPIPELVAFLVVGAVLGPSVLGVVEREQLHDLQPITEISLGILMFIIGERISVRALRGARWVISIGAVQYIVCAGAVYAASRALGAGPSTSLLLGTLAGAGAPMTIASIRSSTRNAPPYAANLIGAHAVSDALAALAFSAALPIAFLLQGDAGIGEAVVRFLQLGVGGAALGIGFGWLMARIVGTIETSGELLLFVLVHVLVAAALARALDLSLPLAALVMGGVSASLPQPAHAQRMFVAARTIEQPLYLLFFAIAGASIHLEKVPELGALGLGYIVVRVLAKIIGAAIGGLLARVRFKRSVGIGLDLVPQAGVAVGLAVLASESNPGAGGNAATVVLGSVVLFELVGPLIVQRSFARKSQNQEPIEPPTPTPQIDDEVPERVLLASPGPAAVPPWLLEWCGRLGTDLSVLARSGAEDLEMLLEAASQANVPLHVEGGEGESFSGNVIRTARRLDADLVVLLMPGKTKIKHTRFALHPHERIVRQLDCPVILLPTPASLAPQKEPQRLP